MARLLTPAYAGDIEALEWCPARFDAERKAPPRMSLSGMVGRLCREIVGEVLRWSADAGATPLELARAALRAHEGRNWDLAVINDAADVIETAFGADSYLDFKLHDGWSFHPDVKWYLDEEFAVLGHDAASLRSRGIFRKALYAGRMHLLRVHHEARTVIVDEWTATHRHATRLEGYESLRNRMSAIPAFALFPGLHQVRVHTVLLRYGRFVETVFNRDDWWHEATKARLRRSIERRRKRSRPEIVGEGCRFCPRAHQCKSLASAIEQGAELEPDASDASVVRRWRALKAASAELEDITRKIVAREGPVDVGEGWCVGEKPKTSRELAFSEEATLQRLRELGMSDKLYRHLARPRGRAIVSLVNKVAKELKGARWREVADTLLRTETKGALDLWRPKDRHVEEVSE